MRNITSNELLNEFNIGWNVGNSLDACKCGGLASELSWDNPPVTKELIDSAIKAGFDMIRVPVTWYNHFVDDNYTIDENWFDRVEEVVNYAYSAGVFVILNTHHEEWFYTSDENYPMASKILICIWEQICKRFENYDERLIFEGVNEPRKIGAHDEWNGGDAEARAVVNRYNADFVRTVRNSGGNNSMRHLMLATYCGCCTEEVMHELEIPKDDKIIVTLHSYQPWKFAAASKKEGAVKEFYEKDTEFMKPLADTFDLMKKYCTDKNIPLIIGEFGCVDRENLTERLKYVRYMKKRSNEIGAKLIWWDNGYTNSFGIFDRTTGKQACPEIISELVKKV